jgi:hypothetical protein
VPWLHLADGQNLSRGGIDTVYRVETAGGKAPETCTGQDATFTVPYAAQCKSELRFFTYLSFNKMTDWIFGPLREQ